MRNFVLVSLFLAFTATAASSESERLFKCDAPDQLSIIAILEGQGLLPLVTVDMPMKKGVDGSRQSCIATPTLQRTNAGVKNYQVFCGPDRVQLVMDGYHAVKSLLRFQPEGFIRYECVPTH